MFSIFSFTCCQQEAGPSVDHELLEAQSRRAEEKRQRDLEAAEQRRIFEAAEDARRKELKAWMGLRGLADVNQERGRTGCMASGFTLPLHMAVRDNDVGAIILLLWGGADKEAKDSAKLTALALATKLDKKGSHEQAIAALKSVSGGNAN